MSISNNSLKLKGQNYKRSCPIAFDFLEREWYNSCMANCETQCAKSCVAIAQFGTVEEQVGFSDAPGTLNPDQYREFCARIEKFALRQDCQRIEEVRAAIQDQLVLLPQPAVTHSTS